ncbi:hypothetical protein Nepgr_017473 [Nepenthes gracilis]|uniref:Uncharacterized protein n=1 Tax=Nepenthes gracilis TaxID=150966 RepID=A0AAD3SSF9_NEPGR|nr:hypothetical protein Nepgr_017473 [Nepenthes gracilis]
MKHRCGDAKWRPHADMQHHQNKHLWLHIEFDCTPSSAHHQGGTMTRHLHKEQETPCMFTIKLQRQRSHQKYLDPPEHQAPPRPISSHGPAPREESREPLDE